MGYCLDWNREYWIPSWEFLVGSVSFILLVFCVLCLFVFVLYLVYTMLPVFSGLSILHCPFSFLWIVHSSLALQFSLDCPFFIAPSVFSNVVYTMLPVSLDCPFFIAPSVFSGLFIRHCPFSFLWIVHSSLPLQFSLTFLYYRTKCVFEVLVIYLINYNKPIPPWCLSVNATSSPSCLLRNIGTNKTSIKKSPALKGHRCVLSNLF